MNFSNTNNKNVSLLNVFLLAFTILLGSCAKEEGVVPAASEPQQKSTAQPHKIGASSASNSLDAINDTERIFEDNESLSEMTAEHRRFSVSEVIRLRAVSSDSIEITNFAPIDITDLTITMEIADRKSDLLKLSRLPAHITKRVYCPLGTSPSQVVLGYDGATPLIQKLKRIQSIKWQIKPHHFNSQNGGWKSTPEARDFRMMTGMMINAAYIMTDPNLLSQLQAHVIFKDDGKSVLTAQEKQADMERLKSITRIDMGVVGANLNTVGLAGIGLYGLSSKL